MYDWRVTRIHRNDNLAASKFLEHKIIPYDEVIERLLNRDTTNE